MVRRRAHRRSSAKSAGHPPVERELRIIGGELRRRRFRFRVDSRTRPMKDRTREAIFNLLGKPEPEVIVLDLFAGTGVMAFEALSRGAGVALCVEQHLPTAKQISQIAQLLKLQERVTVASQDVFQWWRQRCRGGAPLADQPHWVFCCPPYRLLEDEPEAIDRLIGEIWQNLPSNSWFVLEADRNFSLDRLPTANWDVRSYPPAVVYLALSQ